MSLELGYSGRRISSFSFTLETPALETYLAPSTEGKTPFLWWTIIGSNIVFDDEDPLGCFFFYHGDN